MLKPSAHRSRWPSEAAPFADAWLDLKAEAERRARMGFVQKCRPFKWHEWAAQQPTTITVNRQGFHT